MIDLNPAVIPTPDALPSLARECQEQILKAIPALYRAGWSPVEIDAAIQEVVREFHQFEARLRS